MRVRSGGGTCKSDDAFNNEPRRYSERAHLLILNELFTVSIKAELNAYLGSHFIVILLQIQRRVRTPGICCRIVFSF